MSGCNQWVPSALQAQPPHPRQRRVRKQLTRKPLQAVSRMCFFPHRSSCMSRADMKLLQGETGRTPRCCISFHSKLPTLTELQQETRKTHDDLVGFYQKTQRNGALPTHDSTAVCTLRFRSSSVDRISPTVPFNHSTLQLPARTPRRLYPLMRQAKSRKRRARSPRAARVRRMAPPPRQPRST